MGKIQVSKGEPIKFQPPFIILFINQLSSPKSQLGSYCLGERGVWAAVISSRAVSLDHMLAQGEPICPLPSCGRRQPHSTHVHEFFTHGGSHSSYSRTGSHIFPHARRQLISSHGISIQGAIHFSHPCFCRFHHFPNDWEFIFRNING